MTLARLLEPRGVEAQLYPLLEDIGVSPGEYTRNRPEATSMLLTAGNLIMPTEDHEFRPAMIEIVELLGVMGKSQHMLIPYDSPALFSDESRLSKLPTQKVRRYENLPASEKTKTRYTLTDDMLRSVGIEGRAIGYDTTNSKGERDIVQLVDIIRAIEMMEDSYDPDSIKDHSIHKTPGKKYRSGMSAEVLNVPSADPSRRGMTYDISLSHIVIADRWSAEHTGLDTQDARLTFSLRAKDPCPKDTKLMLGYGRQTKTTENLLTADENLLDHHVIFAYLAYQRFIEETRPDQLVPDIFPISHKGFRETYFWPLYHQTLKEKVDPSTGNTVRVPLAMGEIEGMLWAAIGYRNERKSGKIRTRSA